MKRYKIGIIGYFAKGLKKSTGQEVKTWAITEQLQNIYGEGQVYTVDTLNWKKNPFKLLCKLFFLLFRTKNIIMLPAQNSVKIFIPFFTFFNGLFHRKLHYAVVGGWLPYLLTERKSLIRPAKKLDGIYVETQTMKTKLEVMGFSNIYLLPNFKDLPIVDLAKQTSGYERPLKLCTFSRVMKEKGVETAANAVANINKKLGYSALFLDIYGKVGKESQEWFNGFSKNLPIYIRYCGLVPAEKSVEVLKDYFALLFPTHFYTEGVPGTIIDAYAAGLPVISAKWESYADIIDEGITGLGYDFDNTEQFQEILFRMVENPETVFKMKQNCLEKARNYMPEVAIQKIVARLQ